MAKAKTVYVCDICGNDAPRWSGQCPACNEWNSMKEMKLSAQDIKVTKSGTVSTMQNIAEYKEKERITTGIEEFDRVLGGGFISDAFVMLTGDPGVGKSTLALQAAVAISAKQKVLYFSGEESVGQISARAKRIQTSSVIPAKAGIPSSANSSELHGIPDQVRDDKKGAQDNNSKENLLLTSENNLENIFATLENTKVDFVVIDSIQTMFSDSISAVSGSASQVKYCAEQLMHYLKQKGLACLLIGHVTKDGEFAGPQTLAHLVDAVLYLEGDKYHQFRMLRGQKNRFGSTSEIGVFQMENEGLKEVKNPSEAFLEGRLENAEGSVIIPIIEGTRPFLIELQALSSWTNFGYPKRTASGFDVNRLHLMLAVLQKHGNQKLDSLDVFVNVVGGFKVQEPAADLGLLMAVASSKLKKALPNNCVIIGEVGLSGEVRTVSEIARRLKEAEKMGFEQAIIPNIKESLSTKLKLNKVKTIQEALRLL